MRYVISWRARAGFDDLAIDIFSACAAMSTGRGRWRDTSKARRQLHPPEDTFLSVAGYTLTSRQSHDITRSSKNVCLDTSKWPVSRHSPLTSRLVAVTKLASAWCAKAMHGEAQMALRPWTITCTWKKTAVSHNWLHHRCRFSPLRRQAAGPQPSHCLKQHQGNTRLFVHRCGWCFRSLPLLPPLRI